MKRIHETNFLKIASRTDPQNESFENCITKWIHESNLLKTRGFANPNPKDSDGFVYPIVLMICKDLLDSLDSLYSSNLLKIASRNESTKRIFWKLRHETNPWIESFENWQIETKRIHVFTNLLYISRILTNNTFSKEPFRLNWKQFRIGLLN
jgi:hypothetical protein